MENNMTKVIGISGGSGSGKNTLAKKLIEKLDHSLLIKMDDYFIDYSKREKVKAPYCDHYYYDDNSPSSYDLTRAQQDIVSYMNSNKYEYIIIEGLFTFYDEKICNLLGDKIFLDVPSDIRILRRIKRNLSFGYKLEDIINVYIDMARYRHIEPLMTQVTRFSLHSSSDPKTSYKNSMSVNSGSPYRTRLY